MFIRFRQTKRRPRLQVSLVETRKEGRRVRHEHIASLGSIALPFSTTDRVAFWDKLDTRLRGHRKLTGLRPCARGKRLC
jgi:hypothetical protein